MGHPPPLAGRRRCGGALVKPTDQTVDTDTLFTFNNPPFTEDFTSSRVCEVNFLTAANMIKDNHYLHTTGSTVYSFGFYLQNVLAGVMTFGTIPGPNARGICGPTYQHHVLELTRLFIYDWAGRNAESTFLGAVFELLTPRAIKQGGTILLSYADSAVGHVGTIYQSTNWFYTGQSIASKVVLPTGEIVHSRVASDSRTNRSSAGLKRVESPPKHRYVLFLGNKRQRRNLKKHLLWNVLPYPKPAVKVSEATQLTHQSGRVGSIPTDRSTWIDV